ncbi:MAG: MraY family glycosyltransferase [Acidimicrobiales bacterium]
MSSWALAALAAAAVTVLAAPLVVVALRRGGALDRPNERSSHVTPTPRGGGIAVAAGVSVGVVVLGLSRRPWPEAAIAGAGAFALLGLVEDLRGIPALVRLALQGGLAVVVATWLAERWNVPAPWVAVVLAAAALWLVAYVNAFNFMDGINGISVAQVVVAAGAWVVLGLVEHVGALTALAALALGGAVGFAPFNVVRAKVFLGDIGSYGLGALLAGGALVGLQARLAPEAVLAPLLPYLADTSTTILRRVRAGEKWYQPHKRHAYQRLVALGWSHLRTAAFVAAVMVASALLGSVSLAGALPARVAADVALAALLGAYLAAPGYLGRRALRLA